MHKMLCSRCLQRANVFLPSSLSSRKPLSCSHVRSYSRWFALYEDVNPVEIPISELPSSSTFVHESPVGMNNESFRPIRRSISAHSFIPTIVDPSELGGRDTVDDEAIINMLGTSTGSPSTSLYDLDSLLATMEENNIKIPPVDVFNNRDLLPSSSQRASSPLSPSKKVQRSNTIGRRSTRSSSLLSPTRKIGGVRNRLMNNQSIIPLTNVATIGSSTAIASHVMNPSKEIEMIREERVDEITESVDIRTRQGEMDINALMESVKNKDMDELRSIMSTAYWPEAKLSPYQISHIFTLIVEEARDCDECRDIMRDFACGSTRHSLPSHILLLFSSRVAKEEGIQRTLESLSFHSQSFDMPPNSLSGHRNNRLESSRILWKELCKRIDIGKIDDIREVYEKALSLNLIEGPKLFQSEILRTYAERGASFSDIFRLWKEMGNRYGLMEEGMNSVVRVAMNEDDSEGIIERMGCLASYVSSSSHLRVESLIVHMIVVLLSKDKEDVARHVFTLMTIPSKHWTNVLNELKNDKSMNSLNLMEKISSIVSHCVFGETKRGMKKKKTTKIDEDTTDHVVLPEDSLSSQMEAIVWQACGGRKDKRKKKINKNRKRVKIDEKELYELAMKIQNTWMTIANQQDINECRSSLHRLVEWSLNHKLSIPLSLSNIIDSSSSSFPSKGSKRESNV